MLAYYFFERLTNTYLTVTCLRHVTCPDLGSEAMFSQIRNKRLVVTYFQKRA